MCGEPVFAVNLIPPSFGKMTLRQYLKLSINPKEGGADTKHAGSAICFFLRINVAKKVSVVSFLLHLGLEEFVRP